MDPASVDVVLVRPARATNVAAACRALKNMGMRRLWIVGDVDGLDRPEVTALAYGAWDVLDGVLRASDLPEAVAGCTLVAGTSGRPDDDAWSPRRFAAEVASHAGGGRVALVFGPEASGLTNQELALCQVRVHIASDPAQPSLNLAQAVLLLAYEIRLSREDAVAPAAVPRATAGELEQALGELRDGLMGIGYLSRDNPEPILSELRGLLARGAPTPREITLLRGLARQIRWAADRVAPESRSSG